MQTNQSLYAHPEIAVLLLLQNDPKSVESTGKQTEQESELPDFSRIRCPLCEWQPKPLHRWFCAPCDYPESFDDGLRNLLEYFRYRWSLSRLRVSVALDGVSEL